MFRLSRSLHISSQLSGTGNKAGSSQRIIRDGGWKRIKFNPNYYPEHSTGNPLTKHKPTWQKNPNVANNAMNVAKFHKEHKTTRITRIYDEDGVEGERYYQNNHWQVNIKNLENSTIL